jgi:hypothetical protein
VLWLTVGVYALNRSRTETVNLRFTCDVVLALDKPLLILSESGAVVFDNKGELLPPHCSLHPSESITGPMVFSFHLDQGTRLPDNPIREAALHAVDEQSGERFDFSIPGRHETRPRGSGGW